MNPKLSKESAELAKRIRVVNFFRETPLGNESNRAYLCGACDALYAARVIALEELAYLKGLIEATGQYTEKPTVAQWENCIARPGYFPYETFLGSLAEAEMSGGELDSCDARPIGGYSCSPTGISFHKFCDYADNIRICEMKHPLDPFEKTMKVVSIDAATNPEWYIADIAIAITGALARAPRNPTVLAFECERNDLLPEHVLEGALRAKRFDEEFPATWDEKEHDYRLMHTEEPFLLDYHCLVIIREGNEEIVREPLIDPELMN